MSDWGSYIDRQIRKAIEDGEFNDLPGEGKPLNLDINENTPDEMQMAYKILRDAGLAPDWIMDGKALDAKVDELLGRLRRAARAYEAAMNLPNGTSVSRAQAESAWRNAQAKMTASAAKLNQEITTYNLKVPAGVTHKLTVNMGREIRRVVEGE